MTGEIEKQHIWSLLLDIVHSVSRGTFLTAKHTLLGMK